MRIGKNQTAAQVHAAESHPPRRIEPETLPATCFIVKLAFLTATSTTLPKVQPA